MPEPCTRAEIDVVVLRHAPRSGVARACRPRRLPAAAGAAPAVWTLARRPRPAGRGDARRGAQRADSSTTPSTSPILTSSPSCARDAGDDAAALGADLEVDLLGFELDERLADLDAVAFLLQPPRDARLDDRLAELRNDDVRHDDVERFDGCQVTEHETFAV